MKMIIISQLLRVQFLTINLQKENTSKDKLNTAKTINKYSPGQIESINVETIDTESDDEDAELAEEQAAVNCRQELTGDTLSSVVPV